MTGLPQNLGFSPPRRRRAGDTFVIDDPASGCALNLDHHTGNETPDEFVDVTTPAMALRAVRGGVDVSQVELVTTRHFDTDGVLGVWTLYHPDRGADLLLVTDAACRFGDFLEVDLDSPTSVRGAQVSMVLQDHLVPALRATAPRRKVRKLYQVAFGLVDELCTRPESFERWWRRPFDELVAGHETLRSRHRPSEAIPLVEVGEHGPEWRVLFSYFEAPVVTTHDGTDYKIGLEPRCAWEYDARMVGHVQRRDLVRLREELNRREGAEVWSPAPGGHTVDRLMSRGSRLDPDVVQHAVEESVN